MNPEQLNEKIALWLGYEKHKENADKWIDHSNRKIIRKGNFTTSKDTHGPIIEKLRGEYGIVTIAYTYLDDASDSGNECCELIKSNRVVLGYGQAPSMPTAFCLAVEKIIEGEGK